MLFRQPIDYEEACIFIKKYHRHHLPPQGWKFGIGVNNGSQVVGVITVGRPIARHLDDGLTVEVTRCCTDGTKNACSKLYGSAWQVTKALGYTKLITYTLKSESGASLLASNWKIVHQTKDNQSWNRNKRPRVDKHPLQEKLRWEISSPSR